jgi:hypothetical protein
VNVTVVNGVVSLPLWSNTPLVSQLFTASIEQVQAAFTQITVTGLSANTPPTELLVTVERPAIGSTAALRILILFVTQPVLSVPTGVSVSEGAIVAVPVSVSTGGTSSFSILFIN